MLSFVPPFCYLPPYSFVSSFLSLVVPLTFRSSLLSFIFRSISLVFFLSLPFYCLFQGVTVRPLVRSFFRTFLCRIDRSLAWSFVGPPVRSCLGPIDRSLVRSSSALPFDRAFVWSIVRWSDRSVVLPFVRAFVRLFVRWFFRWSDHSCACSIVPLSLRPFVVCFDRLMLSLATPFFIFPSILSLLLFFRWLFV